MEEKKIVTGNQVIAILTVLALVMLDILVIAVLNDNPAHAAYEPQPKPLLPAPPLPVVLTPVKTTPPPLVETKEVGRPDILALAQEKLGVEISSAELDTLILASQKTKVIWQVLAAQYKTESTCGRDKKMYGYDPWRVMDQKQLAAFRLICQKLGQDPTKIRCASCGELGPFQLLPRTFEAYAVDGNADGQLDPWNLADSAATAANYLEALGFQANGPWSAVAKYNGGNNHQARRPQRYAKKVLTLAQELGAPLGLS